MLPIADVQRLAAILPPHVASAGVLLAAALGTLLLGLVRVRRALVRELPALVYVMAGAALFWPLSRPGTPPAGIRAAVAIAALGLVWHWMLHRQEWADQPAASN